MKNILLVYPAVPKDTYWSFTHALGFIKKKSAMPPLGLITIAAYIPDSINLKLVDLNFETLKEKDLKWADAIFVSAMIIQKDSFEKVVAVAKRLDKTIVAGGPYVTSSIEEIKDVDHLVLGEAEDIIETLINDLKAGKAEKIYKAPCRPEMKTTKVPRFDLLDAKSYASMSIQYSRGCPFKCEFCDIWSVYGNKPRLKSAHNIISEMESLYQKGWRGAVFIVDDNFIGNKARVKKELLPALIDWQKKRNYPYRFFTEASINLADDKVLLSGMRDAGFNEVFIGIETPSAECLKETGKVQNLKSDMPRAIKTIQKYGMEVMAGFIMGFDSDTEDIAARQIEFIQKTAIPRAMVGLLMALPGTRLQKRLEEEGRMLETALGNNTHVMSANFQTKMDKEKLMQGYCKVLGTIYDNNLKNYFKRCTSLLDAQGKTELAVREIKTPEIKMLLRSLARQPFTPYGWQYIKFITRNFFKNTSLFSEAVKFSIIGHHYHKITRQMLKMNMAPKALPA